MKKGALELSFGMIFSIFLIIVFLGFAFYVITNFIDFGTNAKIGAFVNDFQNGVDKAWKGFQSSEEEIYNLPDKIEKVCLIDLNSEPKIEEELYEEFEFIADSFESNLFFYPYKNLELTQAKINHIDLEKITEKENPYCFGVSDGEVKIIIKKERDKENNLVEVER